MMRQGDVLIVPVTEMPDGLVPVKPDNGRIILAHGEATGHAHAIKDRGAVLFRDPKLNAVFLLTSDPVALEHDEHDTITIPPGAYRIVRQREYSPDAIRQVAD